MSTPGERQPATSIDLLVLHALRCTGFASLARVSEAIGLPDPEVESQLIDLAIAGQTSFLAGPFGGWGLTEAGKAADAERVVAELAASGARPAVEAAFKAFLVLNPELLDLCAAWQSRDAGRATSSPGDLAGRAYDSRVLDRLADLHLRAEPVLADLSAALARFGRYRVRLAEALGRTRAGQPEYVTDCTSSYHSVWFQLHEDLLVTLGIPRW